MELMSYVSETIHSSIVPYLRSALPGVETVARKSDGLQQLIAQYINIPMCKDVLTADHLPGISFRYSKNPVQLFPIQDRLY
jgi:hypothetical protein